MKRALHVTFLVLLFLAAVQGFVVAQTVMIVADVAAYALEHSRDIADAEGTLSDAKKALGTPLEFEDTSLRLGGGYSTDFAQHDFSVNSSITVPIIPQVSLSASLNDTLADSREPSGSVSLNYSPFGGSKTEYRDWEAYRKAEIALDNLRNIIPMNAEEAALDLIRGQLNLQSAERAMALEERRYEIAQKRFELDDMTFSELEDARSDIGNSRQKYYDAQKSLLALKKNLYQLIGPDLGDVLIDELSVEEMLLLVDAREAELKSAKEGEPVTVSLLNRAVELEALKMQLDSTPLFNPNLSVSANLNYMNLGAGTSVSITLSPNQFQREERDDISAAILDKELDLNLEEANLSLELKMLEQSISVAKEALEISLTDYESAEVQFRETEFLFGLGERTQIELEASELSLFSSQIRLFTSATDLYKNLGDLLLLYRNG